MVRVAPEVLAPGHVRRRVDPAVPDDLLDAEAAHGHERLAATVRLAPEVEDRVTDGLLRRDVLVDEVVERPPLVVQAARATVARGHISPAPAPPVVDVPD